MEEDNKVSRDITDSLTEHSTLEPTKASEPAAGPSETSERNQNSGDEGIEAASYHGEVQRPEGRVSRNTSQRSMVDLRGAVAGLPKDVEENVGTQKDGEEAVKFKKLKLSHRKYRDNSQVRRVSI